jgi:outer membrane receptor protein involved in Fe transport
MKKIYTNLLAALVILLFAVSSFAQTGVGKLSGTVIDADTKEPLIGANIIIVNTNLGAATDLDGNYFILNIVPGNYEARISYVGYAPKTFQEVRIVGGVTYELNVELSTDFTLPDIFVIDRKFFEEKATNTKKVLDAEQINRLPVKGVQRLASLNAGVVIAEGSGGEDGNATINVRGGRGGEVLYIVDGVPQNDVYTGLNYSQVSNAAIEQIAFEIGGYEAKYGQAQAGIVNVTTKTGSAKYSLYGDVLTSSFTDDYGYNLYTASLGGPLIPGVTSQTFFVNYERGWFADADPRAIKLEFPSIGLTYDKLPDNEAAIDRFTGRTSHSFGDWTLRLGANLNWRDYRGFTLSYAKNNPLHNPKTQESNLSFSSRISQNVSSNAFWNLNAGYRVFDYVQGDGVWFDDLEAYGSVARNREFGVELPFNGGRVAQDSINVFWKYGRVFNGYTKQNSESLNLDGDFTMQVDNHLLEIGAGFNTNTLRYFQIAPIGLAADNLQTLTDEARYYRLQPTSFGYDITGRNKSESDAFSDLQLQPGSNDLTNTQTNFAPKKPFLAYGYIQDRFELEDIVLNVGLRIDYFDTQADILKNPELPYAAGDPNIFDSEDFITKDPEVKVSPRIGLGFPVTATTVFHAQYGTFIQQPSLNNLYAGVFNYNNLLRDASLTLFNGQVNSEVTTQYELGFRQVIGDVAALNLTAFYKNTKGLINYQVVFFQRTEGGAFNEYYTPTNSDFGTVKGLAMSLDVSRISYFSMKVDYTLSLAEGTGSSTSSNFIAAFRNTGPDRIPKVIAPLDFDQRHTGTVNIDFYVPEGDLGFFELTNLNLLVSFSSGRPFTPLAEQNLLEGSSNWGDTKGYVNSAFGPGNFRIDMKIEKGFRIGPAYITPYLWIENLLDADNAVSVWRSTGDPYSTAWLATKSGQAFSQGHKYPDQFKADYESLERDPFNFGIPRLVKLGLKINFVDISL